jgi:Spy/CpxP family protein refolding chaperone
VQQNKTLTGIRRSKHGGLRQGALCTLGGLFAVVAMVVTPLTTTAQPSGRGGAPEMKMQDLSEELTLTEDQEARVRTILEEQRGKRATFVQQYQDQTRDARQALQQQFQRLQEETEQRLGTVLTAEQMDAWKAWHEERQTQRRPREQRNSPWQQ